MAVAQFNLRCGMLDAPLGDAIVAAAAELRSGRFDDHFPLTIWQTGSGTQTNMNANEVIANRANERLGQPLGTRSPVHPNDHVNASQSSNDRFPSVMHDLRWMSSGPNSGFGELLLPEDGLTSSIMPGKRNPTIAEVMVQAAMQVPGNHVAVTMAACSGNFELNVAKPVLVYNVLQSIRLLADSANVVATRLIPGIEPACERLDRDLQSPLLAVTALNPVIGYDQAAAITRHAARSRITPRAAIELGLLDGETFDRLVDLRRMAGR